MMRGLVLLLLATAAPLAAQSPAPRELTEAQKAALKKSIDGQKDARANAARDAAARQKQTTSEIVARDQAAAASWDAAPEPEMPAQAPAPVNVMEVFSRTLNSEMSKNMAIVNEGNARVEASRQAMLEQQRREEARQARLAEQQRQQQQLAEQQRRAEQQRQATAQQQAGTSAQAAAASQQAARNAQMQQQVAAERARLTAEREQTAAAERARVMAPFVESTKTARAQGAATASSGIADVKGGTASSMPTPTQAASTADHGPAKAWCQVSEAKTYQCMGPLQRSMSWEKSLDYALSIVGCTGGFGYNPTPGGGGAGFDCGRKLQVGEYRMPLYDPFRGGGSPQRVTGGK